MHQLRAPGGCPWDAEQTHESIKPYLIEEAYEAVEAIESGSDAELCDELGDVLLQVVFHAEMASERGAFDADDVARALCEKLVRRHPHVFAEITVESSAEVAANWATIKAAERTAKTDAPTSVLQGVPRALPSLLRAHRLGRKASSVGFDWPSSAGARAKIDEELAEVEDAIRNGDRDAVGRELGDLLFAVTSYARLLDHNAETVLRETLIRFEERFRALEEDLRRRGLDVAEVDPRELDAAWESSKARS
jgi:MazG family protein